jgi:hypothetical protein
LEWKKQHLLGILKIVRKEAERAEAENARLREQLKGLEWEKRHLLGVLEIIRQETDIMACETLEAENAQLRVQLEALRKAAMTLFGAVNGQIGRNNQGVAPLVEKSQALGRVLRSLEGKTKAALPNTQQE